jgi:ATP-dependent protease ClpP protease subunit
MRDFIECLISAEAKAANAAAAKVPLMIGAKNATANDPAELVMYGEVGDPYENMDASSVGRFLRANKGAPVVVRINSFGGSAYDGITIRNALAGHDGKTTSIIEGIAGSAASIIAIGAQRVKMFENASYFIHRASVLAMGNAETMRDAAKWLDQLDESIARTYKSKTGRSMDKIRDWMRGNVDGTNFSAQEALNEKFIDEILPLKASAPAKSMFDAVPACHRDEVTKRSIPAGLAALKRREARAGDGIFKP